MKTSKNEYHRASHGVYPRGALQRSTCHGDYPRDSLTSYNTTMPNNLHLVTGATGQLGSHIVEQLRCAGESVRVLVRPGGDRAFLEQQGVEIIEGDLRDPSAVGRAVKDAS